MDTLTPDVSPRQESESPQRKIGLEIVRSADLSSRFFRGSRSGWKFIPANDGDEWTRRVANVLRRESAA